MEQNVLTFQNHESKELLYRTCNPKDFDFQPMKKIEDWALLTAGTENKFNMMTITGFLYGKFFTQPMIQIYAHPERYTYSFLEESDLFTVSFFDEPRNHALVIGGTKHGNSCDKLAESNLHPLVYENAVFYEEARTTFLCKKVYHTPVEKELFDSTDLFHQYYKDSKTYHMIYLGQILHILQKEDITL